MPRPLNLTLRREEHGGNVFGGIAPPDPAGDGQNNGHQGLVSPEAGMGAPRNNFSNSRSLVSHLVKQDITKEASTGSLWKHNSESIASLAVGIGITMFYGSFLLCAAYMYYYRGDIGFLFENLDAMRLCIICVITFNAAIFMAGCLLASYSLTNWNMLKNDTCKHEHIWDAFILFSLAMVLALGGCLIWYAVLYYTRFKGMMKEDNSVCSFFTEWCRGSWGILVEFYIVMIALAVSLVLLIIFITVDTIIPACDRHRH